MKETLVTEYITKNKLSNKVTENIINEVSNEIGITLKYRDNYFNARSFYIDHEIVVPTLFNIRSIVEKYTS